MSFCGNCGEAVLEKQKFCESCGQRTNLSNNPRPKESQTEPEIEYEKASLGQNDGKWTASAWLRLTALLGLGYPALTGVIGMPSDAEYVIFDFNADTIINGGWLISYDEIGALTVRYFDVIGLDAGITRLILWAIVGATVSLSFPDFAKALRRFIRSAR